MKVQEVIINEKKRYLLIDKGGFPVIPVAKYIKYLDNIGKAENTLKSYCYHLKLYITLFIIGGDNLLNLQNETILYKFLKEETKPL